MSEEIDRGMLDKIGFIGGGLMGSGMVDRLQIAGYETHLLVHKNRAPIDKASNNGVSLMKIFWTWLIVWKLYFFAFPLVKKSLK